MAEERTALIAVDVQVDFLDGGALGAPGHHAVITPVMQLAEWIDRRLRFRREREAAERR